MKTKSCNHGNGTRLYSVPFFLLLSAPAQQLAKQPWDLNIKGGVLRGQSL